MAATKIIFTAPQVNVLAALVRVDHWDGPVVADKGVWTEVLKTHLASEMNGRVYAGTLGGLVNRKILYFTGKGTKKDPSVVYITPTGVELVTKIGLIDEAGAPLPFVTATQDIVLQGDVVTAKAAPAPKATEAEINEPDFPMQPTQESNPEPATKQEAFENNFFGEAAAKKARAAQKAKERRAAKKAAAQA